MATLPNGERAVVEIRKLEEYCLHDAHPRGRHKARVFRQAIGIDRRDAPWLRDALLAGLRHAEAIPMDRDAHGQRWRVDIEVSRHERRAVIRKIWITRTGEHTPHFVTCWVL